MTTVQSKPRRITHPYITRQPGVCGGKPIIKGTRIKVSQIALYYERMGYTPDQIVQAHPHLTLAQVHDALSYYYDHIQAVDNEIAEEIRRADEHKRRSVSILEHKRGED